MIFFDNLDELKNFLLNDAEKKSFNPVRFINSNSLSERTEIKKILASLPLEFVFLSDFCSDNDTFPNLKRLRYFLRTVQRTVCILPLSELLRISPDRALQEINSFLNLYTGEEYSFRVYFLMYGMKDFFLASKITDPRKKNCILLSRMPSTDSCKLTIVQSSLPLVTADDRADGIRRYLQYWETKSGTSMTLFTDKAVLLHEKKFFDNVQIIVTYYELLRKCYALPAELREECGLEKHWRKLAELAAVSGNFERALHKEFKTGSFDVTVLENFHKQDAFHQWLLWLRYKLQSFGYAALCANESSNPDEFIEQIYGRILSLTDDKNFDEFCTERRILLSLMKCLPPANFAEKVRATEKILALKILTDNSQSEKILIFEMLQSFDFSELEQVIHVLQNSFPALAAYLADAPTCAQAFTPEQANYFRQYRWLKVTNHLCAEFNQLVADIAKRKGKDFYEMASRNQIVNSEYSGNATIFFVDALGAEYLNLLANILASSTKNFSVTYQLGRCNLPSVTELNKDFLTGKNIAGDIIDLDAMKHENLTYPENIMSELLFFDKIKEKLSRMLDRYEKIIICSDHGTSRLASLVRQTEFDTAFPTNGRNAYNNGRFADLLDGDNKKFPTAIEFDDKIIFADYSRFSRQGAPGNEIHGGASWEEVLVPIITIETVKNF